MNRKILRVLVVAIVVVVIIGIAFISNKITGKAVAWEPVVVTSENLPGFLSSLDITHSLHKDTVIYARFGELDYTITKGNAFSGKPENPDITMTLPEEYIGKLGYGPCGAIQEAIRNEELDIETDLSKGQLLWKYKGILKYRDCIGF